MVQEFISSITHLPLGIAIGLVSLYQHTLSPDHGPLKHLWTYGYCRHSPTCSEYAKGALRKRGLVIGSILAAKRILTCNPFTHPSDRKLRELALQQLHTTS